MLAVLAVVIWRTRLPELVESPSRVDGGRLLPLNHVPNDFRARNPWARSADGGRIGLADLGHRGRCAGHHPGQARGSIRYPAIVSTDRRMRAVRAVLRLVGRPPNRV